MRRSLLVLLPLLLSTGCASDVHVAYPSPRAAAEPGAQAREETGRVVVKLTEPMTSVNVMIDGQLVAEDRHTSWVEIRDVPAGERTVHVAASEAFRTRSVDHTEVATVDPDRETVVLIDTPPITSGFWVFMGAACLVALAPFVF